MILRFLRCIWNNCVGGLPPRVLKIGILVQIWFNLPFLNARLVEGCEEVKGPADAINFGSEIFTSGFLSYCIYCYDW